MSASVDRPVVVRARNVSKRHGATEAVADMSLDVYAGEVVALLGPSGCGKSTFLASIAGLVRIDGGTIDLADRRVSGNGVHVPPEDRRVGVVFQDHALFPHKTVADNVGFGLHALTRAERRSRVGDMLDLVRLADKGQRYPHELSGGESQRVALARALAPSPDVILLDEPFASLDPLLRSDVRDEVRSLLNLVGAAAVMVSHDIDDALALGDRLAVLRSGRIVQVGSPEEIHDRPLDEHVARIFGPVTVLPVRVTAEGPVTALGAVTPSVVLAWEQGPVSLTRPHGVEVLVDSSASTEDSVGTVRARHFVGHAARLVVSLADGLEVLGDVPANSVLGVGAQVRVRYRNAQD